MNESDVGEFWNSHPCGDHIVGGLHGEFADDYERFFAAYDAWRYDQERHIPACLDRFDFRDRRVLEIGLGQGAESEQLIRRGARWSGLDLTSESVDRVRARLQLRALPYDNLQQGSALVYSPREVAADFPNFELVEAFSRYMHAPPLPVRMLPAERWLGWHLWVRLRAREGAL
jgi:predicted TPR repeat methyltransferase